MTTSTPFINALIGKGISHIWRGHGSAIFFEFGELISRRAGDGPVGNAVGELTLVIEWSWRIENPRSILGGSWTSENRWQGMFAKILVARVTDVEFFGHIPEISISLSNGRRVASFSTVEGQPEWGLLTRKPSLGSLCVRGGQLNVEAESA